MPFTNYGKDALLRQLFLNTRPAWEPLTYAWAPTQFEFLLLDVAADDDDDDVELTTNKEVTYTGATSVLVTRDATGFQINDTLLSTVSVSLAAPVVWGQQGDLVPVTCVGFAVMMNSGGIDYPIFYGSFGSVSVAQDKYPVLAAGTTGMIVKEV